VSIEIYIDILLRLMDVIRRNRTEKMENQQLFLLHSVTVNPIKWLLR